MFVLFCTTTGAAETSWIGGIAGPATWSITPSRPIDVDTIKFSGPVGHYWNAYKAECDLGGRPILDVDTENKIVELRFVSGNSRRSNTWDPVCGVKGTFGPLEAGSWVFICSQSGIEFSISFDVLGSEQVYYVDAAANGEATGVSWADAFIDLQTALMTVPKGSEIRVAKGTYRPNEGGYYEELDQNASFYIDGVTLKGGFAGSNSSNPRERDTIAYETILSGDLYGDDVSLDYLSNLAEEGSRLENCYHVVVTSGADATTVLEGLTITGGRAAGSETDNFLRCGGGIYNNDGCPIIRDCVIMGNSADFYGGGLYSNSNPGPLLVDCVVFGNWCQWWGGGIFSGGKGDITIERCIISSNGALYRGAGICCYSGTPNISNCNITGNIITEQYGQGGGFYGLQVTAELSYCTIVGNIAGNGAALACESTPSKKSEIEVRHSIIWNDEDSLSTDESSSLSIEYCNVQGAWSGLGNISEDPGFIEMGYWDQAGTLDDLQDDTWYDGDYRLVWESPCVGAGNPRVTPDVDEMDLYDNPRLSGDIVDMGAHEVRNVLPVAQADTAPSGFTLDNTSGIVTFDGSDSYDPEGYPLTYRWYRGSELVSTEAMFSMELALGQHSFTLIVNDGAGDSESLDIIATVHQVIETELRIWPGKIKRGGGIDTILVTLEAPTRSVKDVDDDFQMLLYPGGIQSKHQRVYKQIFGGDVFITGTFSEDEFLVAVPENGSVEVRAVGRLNNGEFFSAAKTVTVR